VYTNQQRTFLTLFEPPTGIKYHGLDGEEALKDVTEVIIDPYVSVIQGRTMLSKVVDPCGAGYNG